MPLPTDLPDGTITPALLRIAEQTLRHYDPHIRTGRDLAGLLGIHPVTLSKLKSGKRPITPRIEAHVRALLDCAYLSALEAPRAFAERLEEELARAGAGAQLNEDQRLVMMFALIRRILDGAALMANTAYFERAINAVRDLLALPVTPNLDEQRRLGAEEMRRFFVEVLREHRLAAGRKGRAKA